ncbi:MAG: hypothetical protein KC441_00040 [Anaerolineales bacterium]|nr:hypothetical protein [Anaerolineales bacterium]
MTRLRQLCARIDLGYFVIVAVVLGALWPFIGRASLPQETDAELHIFRLAELSYLVRGGELYPRWAPNFYHGYGYPIFNYYAPLTYYLGLPVEMLPHLDAVAGVKFVFVLGLLLAAFGTYGFVRDNWGRTAGYVATAVYIYAPYVQYIDPHARGVLAESFSLGVFPMALWSLDRLSRRPTPGRWLTAVFLIAAVILSHNLMAMLFFGILLAWAVWRVLTDRRAAPETSFTSWSPVFGALFLGLGVAAFFWLPVILERNAVNLNTLLGQGDNYDFHTHFLSWRELLTVSGRLDWGATEPVFHFNLGLAQWVLGGLGIVMLLLRRVQRPWHTLFFAIMFVVLGFLMLPISAPVWETLPFLPYFQFPWRLLGAAGFMLAVLAGAGTEALLSMISWRGAKAGMLAAGLTVLPIILALPLLEPAPWPDFGPVFPLRMSLIEQKGRWLGTTSTADYVPTTVDMIPRRNEAVVQGFFDGVPLDRVNRPSLPAGAAVDSQEISPLHFQYTVNSPEDFLLRLFLFDFPGWTARIDGEVVETELGRPARFIVVPVPAGQHVVDVRFQDTPARTLAWVISGVSLLAALLVAVRIAASGSAHGSRSLARGFGRLTDEDWWVLGGVWGVTAVTLLILQPLQVLHYNSRDYTAEPAQHALFADFGEQIALIGYDTSASSARPGDTVTVTLYWQAQRPLDINYQSFLHVMSPDGSLVAQSDHLNPGEFPTRRWPTDKYVRDVHTFTLPPDLPPGEYLVKTGLWVQAEGWRLPLLDASGQQIDDSAGLTTLTVEAR